MENSITSSDDEPPHSRLSVISPKSQYQTVKFLKTQKYRRSNVADLEIYVEHDITRAESLWNLFSPKNSLFDLWSFRLAFWQAYQHLPYFVVAKDKKINIGVIPLWYERDTKKYTWFGSYWHEDNNLWITSPKYIRPVLEHIPKGTILNSILPFLYRSKLLGFVPDEPKYVIDVYKFRSIEEYFLALPKRNRDKLKADYKRINKLSPKLIINRWSDFGTLIKLSQQRLVSIGEIPDTYDKRRLCTFRNIIKNSGELQEYEVKLLTIEIEGQIAAVDLICVYNNRYYSIRGGNDIKNFPGVGNYIHLMEIEDAIKLGKEKVDFLATDCNWKHKWTKPMALYKYVR